MPVVLLLQKQEQRNERSQLSKHTILLSNKHINWLGKCARKILIGFIRQLWRQSLHTSFDTTFTYMRGPSCVEITEIKISRNVYFSFYKMIEKMDNRQQEKTRRAWGNGKTTIQLYSMMHFIKESCELFHLL